MALGGGRGFDKVLRAKFFFWPTFAFCIFKSFKYILLEKLKCPISQGGGGTDQCHKKTQGVKNQSKKCHVLFEWPLSHLHSKDCNTQEEEDETEWSKQFITRKSEISSPQRHLFVTKNTNILEHTGGPRYSRFWYSRF